jgi:hypothetical protein
VTLLTHWREHRGVFARRSQLRDRLFVAAAALALVATTQVDFIRRAAPNDPVLSLDWFHALEDRYVALGPGVPLVLPGADGKLGTDDDRVEQHIVGDVDIVVRAGTNEIVGAIPDPSPWLAGGPPVGIAEPMGAGTPIDFAVTMSDGSDATPYGERAEPDYLDGLPVLVFAFADLDNDGFIGVTLLDGDPGDEELEQAELEAVGRRFAFFRDGIAAGQLHLEVGGPSGAPVRIALAAAMWAGPIDPNFLGGNVPKGPAVMTHVPFVPQTDPFYLLRAGAESPDWPLPTSPDDLVGVAIKEAVDPEPDGPLGEAFTLRLDGSDPTIDVALVRSGRLARFGIARLPSRRSEPQLLRLGLDDTGDPVPYDVPRSFVLADDGADSQQTVWVVPVDRLGNITDLATPAAVLLRTTGPIQILSPDTDGDTSRELVTVSDTSGVALVLDDLGQALDDENEGGLTLEGPIPGMTHEGADREDSAARPSGLAYIDIQLPDPDVDDSGLVDTADLAAVFAAIEKDPRPAPRELDLDGSGRIRREDAYIVFAHLGESAVPDGTTESDEPDEMGSSEENSNDRSTHPSSRYCEEPGRH